MRGFLGVYPDSCSHQSWRRKTGHRPLVLGHRGSRRRAPENTLAAFELARREGADGVELDVRLDASSEVVVCHDRTLTRCTGARDPRDVETLSTRALREVDVGSGERVPLLSDVLAWAAEYEQRLNIELKADVGRPKLLVARVVALLRRIPDAGSRLLLSSFHPGMVLSVARELPRVPAGWIVHRPERLAQAGRRCRSVGAAAVHPAHDLLDAARIRALRASGLVVGTWPVNDADRARQLADWGVDLLITDDPPPVLGALAPR